MTHVRRDQDLVAHQPSPDCPCHPHERLVDVDTIQRDSKPAFAVPNATIHEADELDDAAFAVPPARLGRIDRKESRT